MIVAAIAAYREDPAELERCIASLDTRAVGDVLICCDVDESQAMHTFVHHRDAPLFSGGVTIVAGRWAREREKRSAIVAAARHEGADWVLMLDPDEELVNGGNLPTILANAPADYERVPAFPIVRQEPSGVCWAMPCKLVRADVERFVYLDVAVRWAHAPEPSQSWNLDPWQLGYAVPIGGWPHLVHFRSRRADAQAEPGDAGFYQEDGEQLVTERVYRDELPDVPGVVIVAR